MPRNPSLIVGERLGMLTLIETLERRTKYNGLRWLCRCECGQLTVADSANLQSGHTLSCGCSRPGAERYQSTVHPGYVSGKLTVIEEMLAREATGKGAKRWLCTCECGQLVVVRAGHLAAKRTQSCGCSRRKENRAPVST